MEFLTFIENFASWAVGWILPVLVVLTVVVFFHELGHFLVARWCGVGVRTFSVGFGRELVGFTDRNGTRWRISAIPLGGYVKFLGDENELSQPSRDALDRLSPEDRKHAFASKSVGQRAAIVAAGPIANFILAIAIFTAIFTLYGRQTVDARVDEVVAGSAADKAGFLPGDLILSINGQTVENFNELQRIIGFSGTGELTIVVSRQGEELTLLATPERQEVSDGFGNTIWRSQLGIKRNAGAGEVTTERFSLPQAFVLAISETWFVVDQTVSYVWGVIRGRESVDQLGGPIRVAQVSAQVATLGILPFMNLVALLSVSIGFINLFPIPILDGGHLLFYLIEAVRGRPLSDRAQEFGFRVGLAAVLALMLFVTWLDLGSVWRWLSAT